MRGNIKHKVSAVITAAGESRRMGGGESKVLRNICGRPVIFYPLASFQNCSLVDEIIITCRETDLIYISDIVKSFGFTKVSRIISGGASRCESVEKAVEEISFSDKDFVIIHDGARPCVLVEDIEKLILKAFETSAAVLCIPSRDTLKEVRDGKINGSLNRELVYRILTPQCFNLKLYRDAVSFSKRNGSLEFTDDSSIIQYMGHDVACVEGSSLNIKITVPEDLLLAEAILSVI